MDQRVLRNSHQRPSDPPSRAGSAGLTVVEVLVALVLLGTGLVAAASASAATTRLVARGRSAIRSVEAAARRMESLRATAYRTSPVCIALAGGADSAAGGLVVTWRVGGTASLRSLSVVSTYRMPGGIRADTLLTQLWCG